MVHAVRETTPYTFQIDNLAVSVCRKSKATLLEMSLPKLEKLVKKGKGLNKDVIEDRLQKVVS